MDAFGSSLNLCRVRAQPLRYRFFKNTRLRQNVPPREFHPDAFHSDAFYRDTLQPDTHFVQTCWTSRQFALRLVEPRALALQMFRLLPNKSRLPHNRLPHTTVVFTTLCSTRCLRYTAVCPTRPFTLRPFALHGLLP